MAEQYFEIWIDEGCRLLKFTILYETNKKIDFFFQIAYDFRYKTAHPKMILTHCVNYKKLQSVISLGSSRCGNCSQTFTAKLQ